MENSAGILALVGNTPLCTVSMLSPNGRAVTIDVKLEGTNPSGSVKDRAAIALIRARIDDGSLRPGSTLLDASSGNMGSAIALFGRALGFAVEVVCNTSITADKKRFIEYFGGRVVDNDLGPYTYDGYRKCLAMVAADTTGRYCFLDQLHSWENPGAHEHGTGPEILRARPSCRLVVGSLGSGGTMVGVARALRQADHPALVAGVSSASGSRLPGVGAFADGDYATPFIRAAEDERLFAFTPQVTRVEALACQAELASRGVFCGPQTGAVVVAALRLADELDLGGDIVVISGDAGWKNWMSQ